MMRVGGSLSRFGRSGEEESSFRRKSNRGLPTHSRALYWSLPSLFGKDSIKPSSKLMLYAPVRTKCRASEDRAGGCIKHLSNSLLHEACSILFPISSWHYEYWHPEGTLVKRNDPVLKHHPMKASAERRGVAPRSLWVGSGWNGILSFTLRPQGKE
jgi:hypothetical protein